MSAHENSRQRLQIRTVPVMRFALALHEQDNDLAALYLSFRASTAWAANLGRDTRHRGAIPAR